MSFDESAAGGQGAECCRGFEHGERYFRRVDAKTSMFRDGRERDGIFANYHLLAFHGRTLTRWHQEALGDTDYFLLFDLKLIKHVPHRDTSGFDFLVANRRLGPQGSK